MKTLFEHGKMETGCNYWSSRSGTAMWHDWSPETVSKDLKLLADSGLTVLRVFPLWPDFQPIKHLLGAVSAEIGFRDNYLTPEELEQAGTDPIMMERFRFLADEAEKNHLKLIVSLLNGWMSGRFFLPPAFEGKNVMTDPEVIRWEVRFVRYFVRTFHNHPAVTGWDLGNECNCMGHVTKDQAWCWTHAISSAIRIEDNLHPVISGMHGMGLTPARSWQITDQSELTDCLTTHPYPLFTPCCSKAPLNTVPGTYHAAAESVYYSSIGGKPCFVEEIGNLGPMVACDERTAGYLFTVLASAWVHDLGGLLWWCAFDQNHLTHLPYDGTALERRLGLFRNDGSPKAAVNAIQRFHEFKRQLPFDRLPARKIQCTCIPGRQYEENWTAAFGCFQLAKQAGLEVTFAAWNQKIPETPLYVIPSIVYDEAVPRHLWLELLERVKRGASLMVTEYTGFLEPFDSVFKAKVDYRCMIPRNIEAELPDGETFRCAAPMTLKLIPEGCRVLLSEKDGSPLMLVSDYGKGKVFFLNAPAELEMAERPGTYGSIYRIFAEEAGLKQCFVSKDPGLGITEHVLPDGKKVLMFVNYTDQEQKAVLPDEKGTTFHLKREGNTLIVDGNSMGAVLLNGQEK